ncbi:hypothetical protein FALB51S_01957 [Frigidibacter albus]
MRPGPLAVGTYPIEFQSQIPPKFLLSPRKEISIGQRGTSRRCIGHHNGTPEARPRRRCAAPPQQETTIHEDQSCKPGSDAGCHGRIRPVRAVGRDHADRLFRHFPGQVYRDGGPPVRREIPRREGELLCRGGLCRDAGPVALAGRGSADGCGAVRRVDRADRQPRRAAFRDFGRGRAEPCRPRAAGNGAGRLWPRGDLRQPRGDLQHHRSSGKTRTRCRCCGIRNMPASWRSRRCRRSWARG